MKHLLKISKASIIAIHAVKHLGYKNGQTIGAANLSKELKVSYNHLSKVLQKLSTAKIVASERGPRGGYYLTQKGRTCLLRDILLAIEGKLNYSNCLRSTIKCQAVNCEIRNFLSWLNVTFNELIKKKVNQL